MKNKLLLYITVFGFSLLCTLLFTGALTAEAKSKKGAAEERTPTNQKQVQTKFTSQTSPRKPKAVRLDKKQSKTTEAIDTSDWFIGESDKRDVTIIGHAGEKKVLGLYGIDEEFKDRVTQTWLSTDTGLAAIDEEGNVQCLGLSEKGVEITNTISYEEEVIAILRCIIYISDPQLLYTALRVKPGELLPELITGLTEYSSVTYESNNKKAVTFNVWNELFAVAYGKADLEIRADGKKLKLTVWVSNPKLNTAWFLSIKGKTKQLTVKGKSGATAVTFSSGNSKVAAVSKTGKIKAKKIGNTMITVSVDGIKLKCVVNITYKKALKVINSAKKVLGKRYSQARRMSKNCFDCSSLVWRMYKKQKVYFGSRSWAPTAAMEAKNMVRNKKVISRKYVNQNKLRPGDVIFVSRGYNGRYKNISHTAIYIGNGQIIHATGSHVQYGYYDNYKSSISLIARPLK